MSGGKMDGDEEKVDAELGPDDELDLEDDDLDEDDDDEFDELDEELIDLDDEYDEIGGDDDKPHPGHRFDE